MNNWMEWKSNGRVLAEIGERIILILNIMDKKIKFICHLIRYNDFLNDIFKGKIMGQRPRGRPRINYFHDVKEKMDCTSYRQHLRK